MAIDPVSFMIGFSCASTVSLFARWIERRLRRTWENARTELIAAQDRWTVEQHERHAARIIIVARPALSETTP